MKSNYVVSIIVALTVITTSIVIVTNENEFNEESPEGKKIPGNDNDLNPVGNLSFEEAVNFFGFNLFKKLNDFYEGNIFLSPYSVFTALAMTYEGAKGETEEEMSNVLNVGQNNESLHNYMKNLYELLNKENEEYNISTANALWVRKNLQLLEDYKKIIQDYYGGDSTEVDFSNPTEAAGIINQWIEDNTNGLIKDLISASNIPPLTVLILTNAIYFKGIWKVQFDPVNTTDRDFEIYNGNNVQVPTMKLIDTEDEFNYTENDDLQILELPYTGDDLSMIILLPKNNDLSSIIDSIDDDKLSEWKNSMVETSLDIYLPRFKVETPVLSLNEILIELGMPIAFTGAADFSGITTNADLFISKVLHKAFINVTEEGTEAAAATAVIMLESAPNGGEPPRIVFNCDHPFLYLIQHKETGTILFMGSVTNPSA